MAFSDLLDALGGVGRFQLLYTGLLLLPCSLLACHNFLQNFTAAVPPHHCRGPAGAPANGSEAPRDPPGAPDPCRRLPEPPRAPLSPNASAPGAATEACLDGWVYDRSVFPATIVTEVPGVRAAGRAAGPVVLGGSRGRRPGSWAGAAARPAERPVPAVGPGV